MEQDVKDVLKNRLYNAVEAAFAEVLRKHANRDARPSFFDLRMIEEVRSRDMAVGGAVSEIFYRMSEEQEDSESGLKEISESLSELVRSMEDEAPANVDASAKPNGLTPTQTLVWEALQKLFEHPDLYVHQEEGIEYVHNDRLKELSGGPYPFARKVYPTIRNLTGRKGVSPPSDSLLQDRSPRHVHHWFLLSTLRGAFQKLEHRRTFLRGGVAEQV